MHGLDLSFLLFCFLYFRLGRSNILDFLFSFLTIMIWLLRTLHLFKLLCCLCFFWLSFGRWLCILTPYLFGISTSLLGIQWFVFDKFDVWIKAELWKVWISIHLWIHVKFEEAIVFAIMLSRTMSYQLLSITSHHLSTDGTEPFVLAITN